MRGLVIPVVRKNSWQLAEDLGERTPDGVQRLLNAADWAADAVCDDLRAYVMDQLADPKAVLVVDETGFLKKGTHSVDVKRQYSGTAGRLENRQVGVFFGYASRHGAAFLDRTLYLPKDWAADLARRAQIHVPEVVTLDTKPALALTLVERALDAGVPCRWVTEDEVYDGDRTLWCWLEQRRQLFVLAVACDEPLWRDVPQDQPAKVLSTELPPSTWQRRSTGDGAKGPHYYDWAWQPFWRVQMTLEERAWGHWLWVRQHSDDSNDRATLWRSSRGRTPRWRPWCRWPEGAGPSRWLRGGQTRIQIRRVRDADVGRVIPAHHVGAAGARLLGGHAHAGKKTQGS